MSYLKITWKKSFIGRNQRQRRIIQSLGLRRLHHSVVHQDSPTIKGMVQKVIHMLEVEEISEAQAQSRAKESGTAS